MNHKLPLLAAVLGLGASAQAQLTWVGTTSGAYNVAANWSPNTAAPTFDTTTTFNNNPVNVPGMNTTITIPATKVLITIDSANAAAFTFNGGPIAWFSGNSLSVNSTVTANQVFNTNFAMGTRTGPATNTINANGGSGSTLTINGNYAGGVSVANLAATLALHGSGYGIYNGIISDGTFGGRTIVGRAAAPNNATWELNGANTYTGGTEYGRSGQNNGRIILGHPSALGTGALRLINGATAPNLSANKDLSDLRGTGGANNALANAISFNSPIGGVALTGKTVTLTAGSNTATINDATGVVPGLSIVVANQLPAHTVITAVSGTTLTLSANAAASTPVPPAAATAATINSYSASGGALAISGTHNLEFSGPVDLTPAYVSNGTAGTVTFNVTNTASTIFSGALRQNGGIAVGTPGTFGNVASLAKTGIGTLTLAGANTYAGTTTVTEGTLLVTGSLAASTAVVTAPARAVTVAAAGTLAGNGDITPETVIQGALRPDATGALGGTLDFGGVLELASTATATFDFGGAIFTGVKVNNSAAVTFGGALNLNFLGTVFNGAYRLFNYTGSASGAFTGVAVTGSAPATLSDPEVDGTWTGTSGAVSYTFDQATGFLNVSGGTPPPSPPGVVTGLTATAASGQIDLSWSPTADTTRYIVKRSTVSGGPYTALASNVATTSYSDSGLASVATYYYVVEAANAVGGGGDSAQVSATTLVTAPTGVGITTGDTVANLSWSAVNGATSYTIRRATVSGGPYTDVSTGVVTGTTYQDTSLVNGTTYYYVIATQGAVGGLSPNSSQVSGTPAFPNPTNPATITTTGGYNSVEITWTPGTTVAQYRIYRADLPTESGGAYLQIAFVPSTALRYIDTTALNGVTYYYRVRSVNPASIYGPDTGDFAGTAVEVAPSTPLNLTATAGEAAINLGWTQALGAQTYTIRRSTVSGGSYADLSAGVVAGTATTYSDTTATTGVTYYYVIAAVNPVATGANSNEASATIAGSGSALDTWRESNFPGSTATTGDGANANDFDRDGIANLIEYATGTDPKVPNASVVTVAQAGGVLTLSFPHIADATLTYTVKSSTNLAAGFATTEQAYTGFTAAGDTTYTDTVAPLSSNPRRFLRLEITAP